MIVRRLLLWLGKITDFDRDGVKVLLVVGAINLGFIALLLWPSVESRLFGSEPDCDAACRRAVQELIRENPGLFDPVPTIDVNKIIEEVLQEGRP